MGVPEFPRRTFRTFDVPVPPVPAKEMATEKETEKAGAVAIERY